jgi:hypothetical protein
MYIQKIESNKNRPCFQAVKLLPKEASKSKELFQKLRTPNLLEREIASVQSELFNIFSKHLDKEASLKSTKVISKEDVFSELSILFITLLKKISDTFSLENIIEEINAFKPPKETKQLLIYQESLDKNAYRYSANVKQSDLLTEDNLAIPESEIEIEKKRKKIKTTIKESALSKITTRRLEQRAKGKKYHEIASDEQVSLNAVSLAVRRGIFKIQVDNDCISEDTINSVKAIAKVLYCSEEDVIKAGLIHPNMLYQKPETLKQNLEKLAILLECGEKALIKAGLKQPPIFYQKPETLKQNVEKLAKLLECDEKTLIKAGLRHPYILCQKPETLKQNVEKLANLLECDEKALIKVGLRQPPILYQKPETIKQNVKKLAILLKRDEKDLIKIGLRQPAIFYQKPETLAHRVKLTHYYNKIQNKSLSSAICITSDNQVYTNMICALLKKNNPTDSNYKVSQFRFEKFLKENSYPIINLEIPEDEVAQELIDFAQKTSVKILNKNIFRFTIKKTFEASVQNNLKEIFC